MTLDANNVRVPYTGAARVAPVGTAAPTGSTGVFGAGWVDLGYIHEDGITETPNADWNEVRAWQGRTVVRRTLTSSDVQWQFQLIEQKQETLELYYTGAVMTQTSGQDARLDIVAPSWDPRAFALDLIDGTIHERIIIPQATVTDRGEITYNGTDAIAYDVTITALPSGAVDGQGRPIYATKWSDNPAWVANSSA
jgi:hypothetical protein